MNEKIGNIVWSELTENDVVFEGKSCFYAKNKEGQICLVNWSSQNHDYAQRFLKGQSKKTRVMNDKVIIPAINEFELAKHVLTYGKIV